jgi:hypothetical protein
MHQKKVDFNKHIQETNHYSICLAEDGASSSSSGNDYWFLIRMEVACLTCLSFFIETCVDVFYAYSLCISRPKNQIKPQNK